MPPGLPAPSTRRIPSHWHCCRSCIRQHTEVWPVINPIRMSSFDLLPGSDGQDLLSIHQFESMATPNQGQAHEHTGSSSFVTPLATSPFSPSNSLVGGHAQGVRNTHRQYHTSTPEPVLHGQRRYHPRQYQNTSPFLPIAGSLHQFDGTASMHSLAHDPDPFHGAQHGSFDIPTRRDRAFSSSPLRVNQASALHELSSFPVDPTTPRASNMQHTMHGNTERGRRDEEAFLHYPTSNVGLGAARTQSRTHRYRHEQDRWHSAMMALDGDNPAHMSGTVPPAAFGSSNVGNPSGDWHGTPQATARFDGSDPMLFDERSLLPSSEYYPRVAPRRPQFRPRPSMPTPALHEHHGSRHPSTSAHDFLRGRTNRTSDDITHAVDEDPDHAGQDNYRLYQQTARQIPLMTSPVITGSTLDIHNGHRGQHEAYGFTADGTYHPHWVVPDITMSEAPASRGNHVQEHAAGNANLHLDNTDRGRSATTPQPSQKGSGRKGRTLKPLSNYKKEERAYKRRSGTVCADCRRKKVTVSNWSS